MDLLESPANHLIVLVALLPFMNFLAASAWHYRGGFFPRRPIEVSSLSEFFFKQWFSMLVGNVLSAVLVPFLAPALWSWFSTSKEAGLAVAVVVLFAPSAAHLLGFLVDLPRARD